MRILWPLIIAISLLFTMCPVAADTMVLDYMGRYNCQPGVDHLMSAIAISPTRMVVASVPYLALVDLSALPVNGTSSYLSRLTNYNARNIYLKDYGGTKGKYLFVTEHPMGSFMGSGPSGPWGFSVVKINGDTLTYVTRVSEPNVLFDKMCIAGNYLYVAAHSHGIRVYNIAVPETPALVASLSTGFTDAFAIDVSPTTAYVADGAGGLKIVDVADPAHPALIGGENLTTSVGTAQSISVHNGKVYMTVGSAGLAVYDGSNISSRKVIPTGGLAEDMAWVGDYLAVSTYPALLVFDTTTSPVPTLVVRENSTRRGASASLRVGVGVGSADNNRILMANWNCVDVYQLKPISQSTQVDINATTDRMRFNPVRNTQTVTFTNNGAAGLHLTAASSSAAQFTTDFTARTLAPGQSTSYAITYNGSTPASGVVTFTNDDPDENPFPVQVYGQTQYPDPGELAPDFTLPMLTKDPNTGQFTEGTFTLSQNRGKVIWFDIYASW